MRLGPKIQAPLRCALTGHWNDGKTEFCRPSLASGRQFVVVAFSNGAADRISRGAATGSSGRKA